MISYPQNLPGNQCLTEGDGEQTFPRVARKPFRSGFFISSVSDRNLKKSPPKILSSTYTELSFGHVV